MPPSMARRGAWGAMRRTVSVQFLKGPTLSPNATPMLCAWADSMVSSRAIAAGTATFARSPDIDPDMSTKTITAASIPASSLRRAKTRPVQAEAARRRVSRLPDSRCDSISSVALASRRRRIWKRSDPGTGAVSVHRALLVRPARGSTPVGPNEAPPPPSIPGSTSAASCPGAGTLADPASGAWGLSWPSP